MQAPPRVSRQPSAVTVTLLLAGVHRKRPPGPLQTMSMDVLFVAAISETASRPFPHPGLLRWHLVLLVLLVCTFGIAAAIYAQDTRLS